MPDYLRLVALFGIVVVNVQYIAFSALGSFADPSGETLDAITLWLVNGLALLKTYGLFSFMFGVGLGFLMRSAARRGLPFGRLYRNRMIGPCDPRDRPWLPVLSRRYPDDLRGHRIDPLPVPGLAGAAPGAGRRGVAGRAGPDRATAAAGRAGDAARHRRDGARDPDRRRVLRGRPVPQHRLRLHHAVLPRDPGHAALGWFCLGLAAVKSGMIDDAVHPLWRRARRWCLGPGVALGLLGAAIWQWGPPVPGVVLTIVSAPVATLGYLGLIAALSRPPGPIMAQALKAGGSSLSIYLGQSIILSTIFSGYGLGLWSAVDRLTAVLVALAVTAGCIGLLLIWRVYFKLGPFEWVLRRITYAGLKT
jgi:uncharacterized protein